MRPVSETLEQRLNDTQQTKANNTNPSTYFRVMRHNIPLSTKQFLERIRIAKTDSITDSDVAVAHTKFGKGDEDIWVAYVANGKLKIKHMANTEALSKANWIEYSFEADAVACSIAFDSVARHNASGIWEFITDKVPWVFWIDNAGALKAKMCTPLGVQVVDLALGNVSDVSAVRGPSGEYGNWNLGLTVFFLIGGALFYRQYIDGEWYDAEQVQFSGITGLTISKIKAFNTWDHRVGVQMLTSDGKLYELYSYTEGIGTRGTEHLEFSGVSATATLIGTTYYDTKLGDEHIAFSGLGAGADVIYAHSAVPTSVINVEDSGDWGTKIEVEFNYPNTAQGLLPSMFTLMDSLANNYICQACSVADGKLTLTFDDFSRAGEADSLTLTYTKPSSGGLLSPAVQTNSFEETFVPVNLTIPLTPQPDFDSAVNSADGMTITVTLTEDLINDTVEGIEGHFSISLYEYSYVPDGTLEPTSRSVSNVVKSGDDGLVLTLTAPNISSAIGNVTVIYDGLGGLKGEGGPVPAFSGVFTPAGLTWKGHQNDEEHIEFEGISASATLIAITYYDAQEDGEHISFSGLGASVTLTDVHDL